LDDVAVEKKIITGTLRYVLIYMTQMREHVNKGITELQERMLNMKNLVGEVD
jgi:hypothetical protein